IKNEQKKYNEFIELIVSNSGSMLELVNDLLDVAKLEAGKFQVLKRPTSIADLIKMRVQSFATLAADAKLALESKVEEGMAPVMLDDNKIGQVLNNFLSNAIKFTKEGKVIVSGFTIKKGETLTKKLEALGLSWPGVKEITADADQLVLAVTDTG